MQMKIENEPWWLKWGVIIELRHVMIAVFISQEVLFDIVLAHFPLSRLNLSIIWINYGN